MKIWSFLEHRAAFPEQYVTQEELEQYYKQCQDPKNDARRHHEKEPEKDKP